VPCLSMHRPDSVGPFCQVEPSLQESVAEEGGRNTENTWAKGGKRRRAGPAGCLFTLSACHPGRSAMLSHRPEHLCAVLRTQRRAWLRFSKRAWFFQETMLPLPPRADQFTIALDQPLLVSLPSHPQVVPEPRWKIRPRVCYEHYGQ